MLKVVAASDRAGKLEGCIAAQQWAAVRRGLRERRCSTSDALSRFVWEAAAAAAAPEPWKSGRVFRSSWFSTGGSTLAWVALEAPLQVSGFRRSAKRKRRLQARQGGQGQHLQFCKFWLQSLYLRDRLPG